MRFNQARAKAQCRLAVALEAGAGETALAQFANGRHLVLRGQGHNVVGTGCMPRLLGQFIDTIDAKALDAKCLEQLDYTPPFAGYYGWEP